ncbi:MAG: NAD-binding protein [Thermoanaerobaculia bacterium]|nr:NAD-binding protein [Thermoanaerobaculia bacterium]
MLPSRKRLLLLLIALPALIVVAALIYMTVMSRLEGDPRSFLDSLQWAAETLSTTGYGSDTKWSHPLTVFFVIVLQFMGVFLIFLIFPIYLIPFLEERFEARLPKTATAVGEGAVLVYHFGPAVASLLDELERSGVPSLVIEDEVEEARRLVDRGRPVVYGSLDDGVLGRVPLIGSRALVVNCSDDENAAIILSARQLGYEGDILALVEEPNHRKPMMLAGATAVYTPRHILGATLAARASERLGPRLAGAQALGRKLVVGEVRINRRSRLVGRTLGEAQVGRRTGVSVIGQWMAGRLLTPPTADMRLEPDGIVIVAGSSEGLERFSEECGGTRLRRTGPFVVAGYGEVGQKVAELLEDAGEEVQVIDRRAAEGVDLEGDVMDAQLLEASAVKEAQAVVLAVDSDSATLFATVILKDFAPTVPVIARVNQVQNVDRIHRAGADFALSISQVAGQILAGRLLGQEAISVNPQLKVLRTSAGPLADRHPAELGIRERTGASVVAVERGEELLVEFAPEFRFAPDDEVYVCGSADATQRYLRTFRE